MGLSNRLRERREQLGLTQSEVACILGITPGAVGNYENGVSTPKADILFKVFDALKCDANYLFQDEMKNTSSEDRANPEEMDTLVKPYRALDAHGKDMVNTVIDKETKRIEKFGKLTDTNVITLVEFEASRAPSILVPYWEVGVSAGNGIYQLNDTASVMLDLWKTELTKQADFIIRVSGISMEPDYHDGDKVLVNRKVNVELGEVGIFIKNGDTYIKELGKNELISRNPECPNISVHDFDNVVCMGKVIGTVTDSMIVKN